MMKKANWLIGGFILCLFGVILLESCKPTQAEIPKNKTEQSPKKNYQQYCASCHGEQLKSFINRKWIYGNSWNEVFKGIKEGYPDAGMPGYAETFSDAEVEELTSYILKGIENFTKDEIKSTPASFDVVKSDELTFKLDTIATGLDIPWGLGFLPNDDILITERDGDLFRYRKGEALHEIKGVPEVWSKGQGGLLDVQVHPDFKRNQTIYLSYSKPDGNEKATTAILKATLENDILTDKKVIFEAKPYLGTRYHYGSRLEFDNNGFLFFSVGDRGKRDDNPQYLNNHCGKIHRIRADGTIPKDNPFVDTPNAMPTIYSYGHRNPQGLTLNPETNEIWVNEHGPRGGDELNRIQKGKNYGWPVISYGINYSGSKFTDLTAKDGMVQPEKYWVPSIAPCGMTFVTGERYPNWKGDILSGSLSFRFLSRLKMDNGKVVKEERLLQKIGRLRDVKMGKDGYIYIAVEDPGAVFRLVPVEG